MTSPAAVLVDGSSYLFRAYHALPPLNNSKGHPTGAIKGVINMIRKLERDYPEARLVIIFDAKGKNFRHDLYPEYKANRPPMPDDMAVQIPYIKEITAAFQFPIIEMEGFEADDLIGTYARIAEKNGYSVVMVTGDKDFFGWNAFRQEIVEAL